METTLRAAGILNSSSDCNIPTNENAIAVNSIVGNSIRRSGMQSAMVSTSYPGTNSRVIGSANSIPRSIRQTVTVEISVIKRFASANASFRPRFSRYSTKMGIKLAEIADANIASKNSRGTWLAAIKAAPSTPVAYFAAKNCSRTIPSSFPSRVINIIKLTVLTAWLPFRAIIRS